MGSLSNNSPTQESKEWSGGCQGLGVGGNGKSLTNGYEISVMPQEYILEMCCTARRLWITILHCTWGKKKICGGARSHFKHSSHNSKRKKRGITVSSFFFWRGGLPWWLSGKESACQPGDMGSIRGSGRPPGGGHGNPLQYSCLENPKDREAWWATVHRVAKSQTRLNNDNKQYRALGLIWEDAVLF